MKAASALVEDGAPSASLDGPKARAAPTHPGAPPEQIWSSPWSQPPASGRPKVEDSSLSTSRLSDERAWAEAREAELKGDRQRLCTQLEELEGHTYRKAFGREVDEMEDRLV